MNKIYYNLKIEQVSNVGTFNLVWYVAKIKKLEDGSAELKKIKYSMDYSFHRMLTQATPFGYVDALETYENEMLGTLVIERFDNAKDLENYLEDDFKHRHKFETFKDMYVSRIGKLLTQAVQKDVRERATNIADY